MVKLKYLSKGLFPLFILIVLLAVVYAGCKHEPIPLPQPLRPDSTEDGICFQEDVFPIIMSNCAMSGCHDQGSAQDGVDLSSYAAIMASDVIKPGDPNDSKLYEAITENPGSNDIMPPPPASPLSSSDIAIIYWWINEGALNNPCPSSCDTNVFTFSGAVWPTIQSNCTGCHSGGSPSGGLLLTDYATVVAAVNSNGLYNRINNPASPMPPSGLMSACKIRQIKKWIDAGTLNN